MADPSVVEIPEWTWTKVATGIKSVRLHVKRTTPEYYRTYREYDPDSPDPPDPPDPINPGEIPSEAVRLFSAGQFEQLESGEDIDIYVFCVNQNKKDSYETGAIYVGPYKNYIDVAKQDQDSDAIISKFNQPQALTDLSTNALINTRTLVVSDPTGFIAGLYLTVYTPIFKKFYQGYIISVAGSVLTMDSPLDFSFPSGSAVISSITSMNVDGSTNMQVFGLRNPGPQVPFDVTFDVTRIIFTCFTLQSVSLAKFGDLAKLTYGLVLRKRDGTYKNILNVKNNGEIAGITLDWIPYSAANAIQGQNGFTARLTFNGDEKLGVVQRLGPGEDLEILVQDNLLAAQGQSQITLLECVAEGHIVLF